MEAPLSTESRWPEYDGGALRDALVRASHQLTRRRRRRRFVALAALLATGAIATGVGASGWLAHDVTPAELEQTATVVENDVYLDCGSVVLGCVQKTATHRQVDITPNAGPVPNAVSFALPDGTQVAILPASGV